MIGDRTVEEQETLETYDKIAKTWNSFNEPHFKDEIWYKFTADLPHDAMVLDLGCGTGRDVVSFLSDGFRYVGIDYSGPMLQVARRELANVFRGERAFLCKMDMALLAFRSESFDAFWAVASFMHIPRAKLSSVLAGVHRVLKPGGVGFISTPVGKFEGLYEGRHNRGGKARTLCVCWTPECLSLVLEAAGFKVYWWDLYESMLSYSVCKS